MRDFNRYFIYTEFFLKTIQWTQRTLENYYPARTCGKLCNRKLNDSLKWGVLGCDTSVTKVNPSSSEKHTASIFRVRVRIQSCYMGMFSWDITVNIVTSDLNSGNNWL
jgi:hypothetical protein